MPPTRRVVARYRAKVHTVEGTDCLLGSGAGAGRGHGRLWLGTTPGGHDVVGIAHRFRWALTHGVDALDQAPVSGHRCDNPLCQRIGPGHDTASSA